MKKTIPPSLVKPGHPDYDMAVRIEAEILRRAKGPEKFRATLPTLVRQALDDVIDNLRTGRRTVAELEKTEKAYIGTRVEILVRDYLDLPKGKLDLRLDGLDVDIKNTIGNNWMIGAEILGMPCILVASDEGRHFCYFGIIIARPEYLTAKPNRDAKRGVNAAGFQHIYWMLREEPYPPSFWAGVEEEVAEHILDFEGCGGTERIRRLFTEVQRRPVPREVIAGVARQRDFMKRLRRNGGARDHLVKQGIALLSGNVHAGLIKELGLPQCESDEFISLSPETEVELEALLRGGHLD